MYNKINIPLLFVLMLGPLLVTAQKLYKSTDVKTDFFSSAPIENIRAVSKAGISVLNTETGEIAFEIKIRSFQFRKAKMQEHFNENFMESDKYPLASFKGKIKEPLNLSKKGKSQVLLVGVLDVHGIKKNRKIPATIIIKDEKINLKSSFEVACKDHDIEIPKILWKNIAEVVHVQVNAGYTKI